MDVQHKQYIPDEHVFFCNAFFFFFFFFFFAAAAYLYEI